MDIDSGQKTCLTFSNCMEFTRGGGVTKWHETIKTNNFTRQTEHQINKSFGTILELTFPFLHQNTIFGFSKVRMTL